MAETAWIRRLHALGVWLTQATTSGADPADIHATALQRLGQATPPGARHDPGQPITNLSRPAAA